MAKAKKSSKKKSMAYRLFNKETGHHYVIRLGRDAFDKLKEGTVMKYNPIKRMHMAYTVHKTTK